MSKQPAWSYSSIKLFEQCPKKYYHLRVARDIKDDPNAEHLDYGKRFHKAAELYIRDNVDIPPEFEFAAEALRTLKNRAGLKMCEYEMGLTPDLQPCDFRSPKAWWRGVADLIIIEDDGVARCVDYKTGKSAKYADTGQLELMALAMFKFFPKVHTVKAGLLFVIAGAFPKAEYKREDEPKLWEKWLGDYSRMNASYDNNVWNPKTSGLCRKHCPVTSCPHNGAN